MWLCGGTAWRPLWAITMAQQPWQLEPGLPKPGSGRGTCAHTFPPGARVNLWPVVAAVQLEQQKLKGSAALNRVGVVWNTHCLLPLFSRAGRTGLLAACLSAKSLQSCPTLATPWTVAHQAPLSMWFPRQKYWSVLPFPPPGDLPNPGIKPQYPASSVLAGRFFTTSATCSAYDRVSPLVRSSPHSWPWRS